MLRDPSLLLKFQSLVDLFLNPTYIYNLLSVAEENRIIINKLPYCCDYMRDTSANVKRVVDLKSSTSKSLKIKIRINGRTNGKLDKTICSVCNYDNNPLFNKNYNRIKIVTAELDYNDGKINFDLYFQRKRGLKVRYHYFAFGNSIFLKYVKRRKEYEIRLIEKEYSQNQYIISSSDYSISDFRFRLGGSWINVLYGWISIDNLFIAKDEANTDIEPLRTFIQHVDLSFLD